MGCWSLSTRRRFLLVPMLAVLALTATTQACVIPPSSGVSAGDGAPCATNTPNAVFAKGDGVVAVVFLWFPPQPNGTIPAGGQLSNSREMVCLLREEDGALIAHYDIGATGVYVLTRSLFALSPDSTTLYVSSISPETQSTRLCAVRALSGDLLWCSRLVGYIQQAVVDDHAIYLLENGTLEALDPASGSALWQQSGFDTDQLQPLVLRGDYIYETTSDGITLADELCAWRTEDGTAAWCTHSYKDQAIFRFSADAGFASLVLRLTSSVLVQELRTSDGTEVWQKPLTNILPEQTLNAGTSVYIETGVPTALDYQLLALDAATGSSEWTRDDQDVPLYLVGGAGGFAAVRAGTVIGYLPASTISATPTWQRMLDQGHVGAMVTPQAVDYFAPGPGALRLRDGKRLWEADFCASGSESAPTHGPDGATIWCHWPHVRTGYQSGTVSGTAVFS